EGVCVRDCPSSVNSRGPRSKSIHSRRQQDDCCNLSNRERFVRDRGQVLSQKARVMGAAVPKSYQ
ncbi:hypothetical protein HPB47_027622, partial [Ixodes persulcatus]